MAKGNKIEAALVSMAGTLIYLREMEETLTKKPIIPKGVAAHMSRTQRELGLFNAQCAVVRQAAADDAQPLLTEWLGQLQLPVGGMLSARSAISYRGFTPTGNPVYLRGGIENARLYPYLVAGARAVDLTLVGSELTLPDGRVLRTVSDIPVREQGNYNLSAFREVRHVDAYTKVETLVLHVRIPIQEEQRKAWCTNNTLELL